MNISRVALSSTTSFIVGLLIVGTLFAQPTTQTQPSARRGGRGGIPNATPAQNAAVAQMNTVLTPLAQDLATARKDLLTASLTLPRDDAAIKSKADAVKAADLALASARADGLAKIQTSPDKLSPDQIAVLKDFGAQARGAHMPSTAASPT